MVLFVDDADLDSRHRRARRGQQAPAVGAMIVGGERDHPAPRFGRAIALREPAAEHFGRLAQQIGFDRRRAVEDEVEQAVTGDTRAWARAPPLYESKSGV